MVVECVGRQIIYASEIQRVQVLSPFAPTALDFFDYLRWYGGIHTWYFFFLTHYVLYYIFISNML